MRAAVRGPAVSNTYLHTNPDSYADALDTPPIACGTSASSNIGVDVTAGDSGAPNGFVVEWLTFADFTPEQLMNLARANDWIKEGETWPLSEERCANFLDGDNWDLIAGELAALK